MFMMNWTPYLGTTNDRSRRRARVSLCREKRLTMIAAAWEALGPRDFKYSDLPRVSDVSDVSGVSGVSGVSFVSIVSGTMTQIKK